MKRKANKASTAGALKAVFNQGDTANPSNIAEAKKRKTGRPLKFTPAYFETTLQEYTQQCKAAGETMTLTGYALFAETSRETLREYAVKPGFVDVIKKIHLAVENSIVQLALHAKNPGGPIFILKNHHGYADKTETVISGSVLHAVVPMSIDQAAMELRQLENARQSRQLLPVNVTSMQ